MIKLGDTALEGEDIFSIGDVDFESLYLSFPPDGNGVDPLKVCVDGKIFYYRIFQKNPSNKPVSYYYEFLRRNNDGSYTRIGFISYRAWNFLCWNLEWALGKIVDFVSAASEEDRDKLRIMYSLWRGNKK
jgi:hypothetical protein